MDYKYMRVFQYNGETRGVATFQGSDKELESEQVNPMDYTILHKRIRILEGSTYVDAKLPDGFYPYDHFELMNFRAEVIMEGEEAEARSGPHYWEYRTQGNRIH